MSAVSPGSRTISSRIQPAIRRNLRPSSSAIGESWTVRPSTSFRTRRASWWNRSHLEAWQAFARALPDLLGGLVRERDEGDRLGRRAEAAGGVARPRHHRPGLAGPGAGGDHRPVFEARGGPPLVRVQGRQQPVGAGGDLRAPVPPGPFRRGEAARGQPDSERGGRFGEPPPGPEAVRASGSSEVEGALPPPDARGRNQPAPLLDPRLGGVGARGRRDLSRRSGLPAPIGLAGIYTSTLRRQYRLVLFRKQGWLYPLLSRRLLVTLFWTGWALATSFLLLLLRFHVYGWVEWTVLAATIPVFALVFAAIRRVLVMGTAR